MSLVTKLSKFSDVEVVRFEDPMKKRKQNAEEENKESKHQKREEEKDDKQKREKIFDMKKCRFDVYKFGVQGFSRKEKLKEKDSLLIKLGAKPRKREFRNYKEILAEKAEEKRKAKEEHERKLKGEETNLLMPKRKEKKEKKRNPNAPRGLSYQVGKYKDGVQFISKNLLKKRR